MRGIALARRQRAWLLTCLLITSAFGAQAGTVELVPDERAGWLPRNLLAFLRPRHYYGQRWLEIETTPPGATLDLFYVRAGFQKRYEQSTAPATVLLPRRIEAGPRDSVTVRAFADGYRNEAVRIRVASSQTHLLVELEPLPNTLRAVAHTYFAGRASIAFLLEEQPTVRMLQDQAGGFSVILAETARSSQVAERVDRIQSPLVRKIEAQQLGEDLLVRVQLDPGHERSSVELRSRQNQDTLRGLHRFVIDLVPADRGAAAVEQTRAALERLRGTALTGCAATFDATLRRALDPAALSRALTPRGEFTDPFLRAALRRLGEVSADGRIRLANGSRYRPEVPLELAAAASQAASAQGYLALLERLVEELEPPAYRAETLRSLVAPELEPSRFAAILAEAKAAEARCRDGGARAGGLGAAPAPRELGLR